MKPMVLTIDLYMHGRIHKKGDDDMKEKDQAYWKATLRLLAIILAIWVTVSLGLSIVFAPWLNSIKLGGYPLGFWFAQQGSIYVFIALIFIYAKRMSALDEKFDVHEK
jgi:putative solute:sodium symporter small subunit